MRHSPSTGTMESMTALYEETMMRRLSRTAKLLSVPIMASALAGAGGCVGDNFWANKVDEIANGLIIAAINLALAPTGIQL